MKTGDRIYVKKLFVNKHDLAFFLAIEHTKKEIVRLYESSSSIMVGAAEIPEINALRLSDVFKLDADALLTKRVVYQDLYSKMGAAN
jgi:hypothetical protein